MTNHDDTYAYRLAFLNVIEKLMKTTKINGKRLSHSEFARQTWPNATDPVRLWRTVRHRGRAFGIEEAREAARTLKTTLSYLFLLAEEELKTILIEEEKSKVIPITAGNKK